MDYALGEPAEDLRTRLRELLAEHVPEDYLSPFTDRPVDLEISRTFVRLLAEEGLLALAWPTEYGGGGGSVEEQTVVREEMWAHYEPRANHYMGLNWIGPALMRFGTQDQKARLLPAIASGAVGWCQGFSEPEAGTDLASLRTTATPDEDGGWRITGQKIWTSYAPMADYCMLAVRSNPEAPRGSGLSLFMLPMDRPGVQVRPIDSMLGHQHLNEVFLDEVPVTAEDLLGELHGGWTVMRYALNFERVGIARYARTDRLLARLLEHLGDRPVPPALRARLVRSAVHNRIGRLLSYRVIDSQARGEVEDVHSAAARFAVTRAEQEFADVAMELLGEEAFDGSGVDDAPLGGAIEDFWRYTRASTIASGSIDVLRMHLARSVLGAEHGSSNT